MSSLITGLFDIHESAEVAVSQLKQQGYTAGEISVIMKDAQQAHDLADATDTHAQETSTAAIGGGVGALLGGLLAVGAVAIPGVGLIAAGTLAAMFIGAGGLTGSLVGWFVGAGVPEDIAPIYEQGLHAGGIVIAVAAHPGDEANVQRILHDCAVAYANPGAPSYIAPHYAARHAGSRNPDV